MYELIFYNIKRRCSLVIVLTILSSYSFAQTKKIDSLEQVVDNNFGIQRYDALINLVRELSLTDDNAAYEKALEANKLAYQYADSFKIVNSSRMMGQLLNRLSRPKEAEKILVKTISIAKRNKMRTEYKTMLNNLAIAYTTQAMYDKALQVNFETLVLREEDGNEADISISMNNIGLVYFKLGNFEKALIYYNQALEIKKRIKDNNFLERLLVNIGMCYSQMQNFSKANDYFEKAFEACDDKCGNEIFVEGNFGHGASYFGLKDYVKSKKYFSASYSRAKAARYVRFEAENLIYLADIYVIENNLDSALITLHDCERIAIELGYNELLIEAYQKFSNIYSKSRNFEMVSFYQNKYIHLKDSIYSETLIKNLAKVQADYEQRENKAIIATKEEVIKRQRNLNVAVAVIAILCILLVFVLYHSNRVKKRVNQALSDAKNFIELKNRELDKKVAEKTVDLEVANISLSKVNEELDNFIYKTSHDIRGPLASLKGICNVALLDVKDTVAIDYLHKLDLTAEHLNSILTRLLIINQINNSSMKSESVDFNALINEIIRLELKKGMPTHIKVYKEIQAGIQYFADREFVRIIFENLINNAVKFHNHSGRVEPFIKIQVEQVEEELHVRVIDNGIGINELRTDKLFQMFSRASERSNTGGIGLYITKTATEKLGGKVGLRKTAEGYTEFFIRFPIIPPRMA